MADAAPSIFNKKAAEKLRSPDDLDKYVRVTSPSGWALLAACLALLAGLLAWGVLGTVSTSVETTGAFVNDQTVCFLSAKEAAKVKVGDVASVDGVSMVVAEVAEVPLSRGEAAKELTSDYLVNTLIKGDWVYPVRFEVPKKGKAAGNLAQGVPLTVKITTERIAPITLLFG